MKILLVHENWKGSCGLTLHDALSKLEGLVINAIHEDYYFPKQSSLFGRIQYKLLKSLRTVAFNKAVLAELDRVKPDVFLVYKGWSVHRKLLAQIKSRGVLTVNVYPDCSPHSHGNDHRDAVGEYDLVISTKPFHKELWSSVYAYGNSIEFVPQGYDSSVHMRTTPPEHPSFDISMVATYREEYKQLLIDMVKGFSGRKYSAVIGGYGWDSHRHEFPDNWAFPGAVHGERYISTLRSSKLVIAPLNTIANKSNANMPGDVDTTRTYELAASHCFFIHKYTEYARGLYTEDEVPMFNNADDLSHLIMKYLQDDAARMEMASKAHARAVPAYSMDNRAVRIKELLQDYLAEHRDIPAL